jgi:hypothetical protein
MAQQQSCDLCNNKRTQPKQSAGGHIPLYINNNLECNGSCPWCYECCFYYHENQTIDCPTCLRKYSIDNILLDSPANSGYEISCNHWQCQSCWATAGAAMQYNCPFCNENLKDWMKIQSYDSSENGELEMNCDILLPK